MFSHPVSRIAGIFHTLDMAASLSDVLLSLCRTIRASCRSQYQRQTNEDAISVSRTATVEITPTATATQTPARCRGETTSTIACPTTRPAIYGKPTAPRKLHRRRHGAIRRGRQSRQQKKMDAHVRCSSVPGRPGRGRLRQRVGQIATDTQRHPITVLHRHYDNTSFDLVQLGRHSRATETCARTTSVSSSGWPISPPLPPTPEVT